MLIVFGGLPGTGKTTISRSLAGRLKSMYLRIDTIEQVLRQVDSLKTGVEGYMVSYAIAEDNIRMGNTVVIDAVNPVPATRDTWKIIAARNAVKLFEVEVVCSDSKEHRRRVEMRKPDIDGHRMPTWQDVVDREYHAWSGVDCVIDTFQYESDDSVNFLIQKLITV